MLNLLSSGYFKVLEFLAGALPDSNGFSESVVVAFGQVMITGRQLDFAINWTVILSCLSAVIIFEGYFFSMKIIMWAIKLIRG